MRYFIITPAMIPALVKIFKTKNAASLLALLEKITKKKKNGT